MTLALLLWVTSLAGAHVATVSRPRRGLATARAVLALLLALEALSASMWVYAAIRPHLGVDGPAWAAALLVVLAMLYPSILALGSSPSNADAPDADAQAPGEEPTFPPLDMPSRFSSHPHRESP